MYIHEVLQSGRPFRLYRVGERTFDWDSWYTVDTWLKGYLYKGVLDEENQKMLLLDIQSNNWVLQKEPITITHEQFWKAYYEVVQDYGNKGNPLEQLATALGFTGKTINFTGTVKC